MRKFKFKIGDKVVLIDDNYIVIKGAVGIVKENDDCPFVEFEPEWFKLGEVGVYYQQHLNLQVCVDEDNLVLEEIYDSPLYKALSEE